MNRAIDFVSLFGCELVGKGDTPILGVGPLEGAESTQVSFVQGPKHLALAKASQAGVLIVPASCLEELRTHFPTRDYLVHANPSVCFAKVSQFFYKPIPSFSGQSSQSFVDASASLHPTVTVFPFVFVGPGAVVEEHVVLYPGVFIGAGSRIGAGSTLYPNSVVLEGSVIGPRNILQPGCVVGADGFGFAPDGLQNVKVPQWGNVILGADVELGANSSIDRATYGSTRIGDQVKIDNLVQIGHNCEVGEGSILCGQSGLAGSTKLGRRVTLAGQAGTAGHLKIADHTTIGGQSGVTKDIKEPGFYAGTPCKPNRVYLKEMAFVSRLSKLNDTKPNDAKSVDTKSD